MGQTTRRRPPHQPQSQLHQLEAGYFSNPDYNNLLHGPIIGRHETQSKRNDRRNREFYFQREQGGGQRDWVSETKNITMTKIYGTAATTCLTSFFALCQWWLLNITLTL